MKMRLTLIVLLSAFLLSCGGDTKSNQDGEEQKMKVIFETDMGNDIDDALALDMLYKYLDDERIDLLAISTNKEGVASPEFIDIMATWYGYPNIPIGVVEDGSFCETDAINYAQLTCEMELGGEPMFKRSISDYSALPTSVELYRKVLSEQEDNSVTLISVGFSTNIAKLLDSPADQYSPLTGRELVAQKVKILSVMAGHFVENRFAEYNVMKDVEAARKVFEEWPTEIVASPFEVGFNIMYPGASIENDFGWAEHHPMVEAYKVYLEMPYDRPTWDLTAILYMMDEGKEMFGISPKGTITIDEEGKSYFEADDKGRHYVLSVTEEQAEQVKNYFVELISRKPLNFK